MFSIKLAFEKVFEKVFEKIKSIGFLSIKIAFEMAL